MGNERKRGEPDAVPHLRKVGSSTQLVVRGRPFIMLAGEVHNSSSSNLEYMEHVWDRMKALNCNTALVPVFWELVEQEEGRFDFGLVDGLARGAREHGMKLVPLWFGTWKNAMSTYAPAWVKTDTRRFPRAEIAPGETCGAISCLSEEACECDARAFAALMSHVREIDRDEHTVVMVQVENETGLLGSARDRSAAAEESFRTPVPDELVRYLGRHEGELRPELAARWKEAGSRTLAHRDGTWPEVFGPRADEVFMAWHVARFVDRVAEAGQAEYPLPMFVNTWLVHFDGQPPGEYPSGGPVSGMTDVWRCAAPHIALVAPDIYLEDFAGVSDEYARGGNPLLVPEARRSEVAAGNVFYALGRHDAICFSPFGIEGVPEDGPLTRCYEVLSHMLPVIAEHHGTGRMTGVVRGDGRPQMLELGGFLLRVRFTALGEPGQAPGAAIIIAPADGEYIVVGHGVAVDFLPGPGEGRRVDFISLDEGEYRDGEWVQGRRLNGDEYKLVLGERAGVRRARLYSYE